MEFRSGLVLGIVIGLVLGSVVGEARARARRALRDLRATRDTIRNLFRLWRSETWRGVKYGAGGMAVLALALWLWLESL